MACALWMHAAGACLGVLLSAVREGGAAGEESLQRNLLLASLAHIRGLVECRASRNAHKPSARSAEVLAQEQAELAQLQSAARRCLDGRDGVAALLLDTGVAAAEVAEPAACMSLWEANVAFGCASASLTGAHCTT